MVAGIAIRHRRAEFDGVFPHQIRLEQIRLEQIRLGVIAMDNEKLLGFGGGVRTSTAKVGKGIIVDPDPLAPSR